MFTTKASSGLARYPSLLCKVRLLSPQTSRQASVSCRFLGSSPQLHGHGQLFITNVKLLHFPARPPHLDGVVVRHRDQHLLVARVEWHGIDHVVVGKFGEACAVVAVPQVAMFILSTTANIARTSFNFILKVVRHRYYKILFTATQSANRHRKLFLTWPERFKVKINAKYWTELISFTNNFFKGPNRHNMAYVCIFLAIT